MITMLVVWILGLVLLPYCSDGFSVGARGGLSTRRAYMVGRYSSTRPHPYSSTCRSASDSDTTIGEGEDGESSSKTSMSSSLSSDAATAENVEFTDADENNKKQEEDDDPATRQKSDRPRFQLQYTCGVCKTRNINMVSYDAYQNGVVIATCKNCSKSHLIADNLGWMKYDRGGFGKHESNIEDMLKNRKGKKVRRMKMDTWKQLEGLELDPSMMSSPPPSDETTSTTTTTATAAEQSAETTPPKQEDEEILVAGRGRVTKGDEPPPLLPF